MNHRFATAAFCLTLALLLGHAAFAQDSQWQLTTADFNCRSVALRALTEQGVVVSVQDPTQPEQTIRYSEFLEISRTATPAWSTPPVAPTTNTVPLQLLLNSGDRLVGEPVSIEDEQLTWDSAILGKVRFALSQVRAIMRADQSAMVEEQRKEDVVLLGNGDSVRGVVKNLAPDQVTVAPSAGGDATSVPMDSVSAIILASTSPNAPAAASQRAFRVRLDDGSSITAPSLKLPPTSALSLTLSDQSTHEVNRDRILAIEQVNGPVCWLSACSPAENVQTPYDTDLTWPARMDQNVLGKPIRFGDRTFARGIGVHAYSRLVFPIDASQYKAFRTQYAIDTSATDGRFAEVTVRVKLGDRVVHEQKGFHAGTLSSVVIMPLADAKTLTLEVDYGGNGDRQARMNWIEPALLRAAPTTVPTSQP
jgi:hypothetical protein